ncbi:MAG: class I SAM-dependent methyltransferase [Ignavibacteriaceae bacterium]
MCLVHQMDAQKAEDFAGKLLQVMNNGATALMISVGHRTGLFDTLKKMPPSTSHEIAEASGLNERYVREWLGAMTTGKIVEYNPETTTYSLPSEHAAFLTRDAGADNIAVFTQYISVLGSVEDNIVECFMNGGGVPYSEYKRFHEVMADDSGQSVVSSLIDVILPSIPGLIEKLEKGITVLDIGCGKGRALNLLAKKFPNSRFKGVDLSKEAVNSAALEAERAGLKNVVFDIQDLTHFNLTAPEKIYDLITSFDAIHDQARPDNVLSGINTALKDDGIYLMQDISASSELNNNMELPLGPLLYTVSTMHCMTVSLAQNGMGLGTMWGREKAVEMLNEAGFTNIEIKNFKHDIQNDYYIIKK